MTEGTTAMIATTAEVGPSARLGVGTKVWQLAQVRDGAVLGAGCVVGRGAYVGPGVIVGDNCKLQNYALVYEPAVLGTGVFIGPGAVLTNDTHPRAVRPDGVLKSASDWTSTGVTVGEGASIGAHATCVAPVVIGRWAVVAAGCVVVDDVPDFALVAGVPGRRVRWVGRAGVPLVGDDVAGYRCPVTDARYELRGDVLVELTDVT